MKPLKEYDEEHNQALTDFLSLALKLQHMPHWDAAVEQQLEINIGYALQRLMAVNEVYRAARTLSSDSFLSGDGVLVAHRQITRDGPLFPVIYYAKWGVREQHEVCPDCANTLGNDAEQYDNEEVVLRGEIFYENQVYTCEVCDKELVAEVLP